MKLKNQTELLQMCYEKNIKIAELEAYNEKLLNGDIEKHNKIVELVLQIEKMKNCANCKHFNEDEFDCRGCNKKFEKWELKE